MYIVFLKSAKQSITNKFKTDSMVFRGFYLLLFYKYENILIYLQYKSGVLFTYCIYRRQYPRQNMIQKITSPIIVKAINTKIKINHQVSSQRKLLQYDMPSQSLSKTHTSSGSKNLGFPGKPFRCCGDGIP